MSSHSVRSMVFRFALVCLVLSVPSMADPGPSDPFLWLEEVDGERALDWVAERNAKTKATLTKDAGFATLEKQLLELYNDDSRIAYPSLQGDHVYNFWKDENNQRGIWRRASLASYLKTDEPRWEVLLDVDALGAAEGEKWVWKGADCLAPDYQRCLLFLSPGGGDASEVREFDIATKSFVKDGFTLPVAKSRITWVDRDTVLVGTDYGPDSMSTAGYPIEMRRWSRGTALAEAPVTFRGEQTDAFMWAATMHTPSRSYTMIQRYMTFYDFEVHVIEGDEWIKLDIPSDADATFFRDQLVLELRQDWTVGGATHVGGTLLAIDYARFLDGKRDFAVLVEPEDRVSIDSVIPTGEQLLVSLLDNVRNELFQFTLAEGTWQREAVETPGLGRLGVVSTDDQGAGYFYIYEDFLVPDTLFYADGASMRKVDSLPAYFDAAPLESVQYEATSKDGTKVPYFVVHRKDMKLDGRNPTVLYGYGGFEVSLRPAYSSVVGMAWLAEGGVYVRANIRGGGEFGAEWHRAALKENRQRAYDDFLAVAEDLIARKITSPDHLGIRGGSNGGLLVGVAFTQRPDLFDAVVCAVPLLDMKRYDQLLAGASWEGEYGDPEDPAQWAYIRRYSPYHNVKSSKEVDYPRVLFTTSTRDDRVHPGHARKMAALMESLGHDYLYWENVEGGHAGASTNEQSAFREALVYTYLRERLTPPPVVDRSTAPSGE
ncbi:MAG: prolyl oligopeptidase family serine peptidase [Acidobacteriota bacterium]